MAFNAGFANEFGKRYGATVENGNLFAGQQAKSIVYSHGPKGAHEMLYRRNFCDTHANSGGQSGGLNKIYIGGKSRGKII